MSTKIGHVNGVDINAGTSAGAAYVNKITHPPSPMTSEYLGRPDCSAPNVVLMELKSEVNIAPILTFPTSATATKTINPSSMLFIQTSGAVVMNYVFMWLADADAKVQGWVQPQGQASTTTQPNVSQRTEPAVRSAGYNFSQWQTDIASHRATYKSSTYYLNATNFNNQGIVTSAKFKPDIVRGDNLLALLKSHEGDVTSTKSLITAIKAACSHQGFDFRFSSEAEGFVLVNKDSGLKAPTETISYQFWDMGRFEGSQETLGDVLPNSTQIYWNKLFPPTSSQLLVSSPKAATRPAREGAFVVQQQEDETIPFISNFATTQSVAAIPIGLNLSFIRYLAGQKAIYIPLYNQSTTGNTFSPLTAEVPWGSLDWSFTMFEGLTVPNTVGTTLTSVPYVTVKSILGLELQPRPTSSLATFQRTLPLPDTDAIKMAIGIMHARPDSLPAAANDLGSIAATAIKFIPTAVSWLKQIFGGNNSTSAKEKVIVQRPRKKNNNNGRSNNINKQISALTSAVSQMRMQSSKATAPATQLPSYNEMPVKNGGLRRSSRRATPASMTRTNLQMRQRSRRSRALDSKGNLKSRFERGLD